MGKAKDPIQNDLRPKKYVILTSSGGGGHTNAAEARKAELLALFREEIVNICKEELRDRHNEEVTEDIIAKELKDNEIFIEAQLKERAEQIEIIDLMGIYGKSANKGDPWVPSYSAVGLRPFFSGEANTEKWNSSQKEGTEAAVRRLENLVELQPLAEAMQADEVQKRLSEYLENNNVVEVFNTQALSTPAICQAVVDYNKKHQDNQLNILTTVTDLITHRAEHFLNSLRSLSQVQRDVLTMEIAAAPMCAPGEDEAVFLQRYKLEGLLKKKHNIALDKKTGKITREEPKGEGYPSPVKSCYHEKANLQVICIKASVDVEGERNYIKNQLSGAQYTEDSQKSNDINITKSEGDKLITITMGSQGSNSVLEYMDSFAEQIKAHPPMGDGNIYLCIMTGNKTAAEGSLLKKSQKRAAKIMNDLPENLKRRVKILPLAFQDGEHMASLLNNSDVLITRSGGMSSMEAEATNGGNPNRQVYVHSEAKLKYPNDFPKHSYDATYESLMTGTVKWEGGNAEYLLRKIGASLGSPETVDFGFEGVERQSVIENSLFHLAYANELREGNLAKIEQLIREGSNPNLRFPGGSYLIDHCQDIETKILLVKYGASLTIKSLEGLEEKDKNSLIEAKESFKRDGAPKEPINQGIERNLEREKKAYKYLHPFEPNTPLEKVIMGIERFGDYINSKILKVDYVHDSLDGLRLYLQTDPTEKRNVVKRLRQARNFVIDVVLFIGKQPVNMVVKPISMSANLIKLGLIASGAIINDAQGTRSNICGYDNFKRVGKSVLANARDSLIAWGSAALLLSGFGTPIAIACGGTAVSLSLGAVNLGAANATVAVLNSQLVQSVGLLNTPSMSAVMTAEGVVEWGLLRPVAYVALNPKRLFYKDKNDNSQENVSTSSKIKGTSNLNELGEQVQSLHKQATDLKNTIEARRQARGEIDKLIKAQKIQKVVAPALKAFVKPFKVNASNR